jgi:hypothetical protein
MCFSGSSYHFRLIRTENASRSIKKPYREISKSELTFVRVEIGRISGAKCSPPIKMSISKQTSSILYRNSHDKVPPKQRLMRQYSDDENDLSPD